MVEMVEERIKLATFFKKYHDTVKELNKEFYEINKQKIYIKWEHEPEFIQVRKGINKISVETIYHTRFDIDDAGVDIVVVKLPIKKEEKLISKINFKHSGMFINIGLDWWNSVNRNVVTFSIRVNDTYSVDVEGSLFSLELFPEEISSIKIEKTTEMKGNKIRNTIVEDKFSNPKNIISEILTSYEGDYT